jgi:hypothetical protein
MKIQVGMMVFHDKLGAGKVLKIFAFTKSIQVAFLQYAADVRINNEDVKICMMKDKWEEIQKLFKETTKGE